MSGTVYREGPLLTASRDTPTSLWNDSSDIEELSQSIAFGAVGATCNPVIAHATISKHLDVWAPRIREFAANSPTSSDADIGWQAVKQMSIEAAKLLEPIFHEHNGRNGRLSVQTDPSLHRNRRALIDQALEFHDLAENIIVKIPAMQVGLQAIEEATARGVSVNVTVSFSVSQALAAAEAIERGLDRRLNASEEISTMGPVVTIMGGRLDDWLKHVVKRDRMYIDPSALEWAGIATLKRAYSLFQQRGFRSRVLCAAFRNVNQWAELVGGDLVISPPFHWQELIQQSDYEVVEKVFNPVDDDYLRELNKIPDFRRAYDEDGMTPADFDSFGPTLRTLRQFLVANNDLEGLVRDILLPDP